MRVLLSIFVAIVFSVPGVIYADDTAEKSDAIPQIALSSVNLNLGHALESQDKEDSEQPQQSAAVEDETTSDLKPLLNSDKGLESPSGQIVFYSSPEDHFRIKPFHKLGATGLAGQIRW